MITFPEDPHDGMEIIDYVDSVTVIIWTYDESLNQWTSKQFGTPETYVFTDQVLVRDNIEELPAGAEVDPSQLKTQKDVNYFLNDRQPDMPDVPSLDGYATEQWVQDQNYATQTQLAQLQQEVDNLSGLVVQARYSNGNGLNTRPGEFLVLKDNTQQTRFSVGDTLRLDQTDATNKTPALARIISGDLIHIVDPRTSQYTVLQVTSAAGVVHEYTCLGGTMDTIPNNTALEFRISGGT